MAAATALIARAGRPIVQDGLRCDFQRALGIRLAVVLAVLLVVVVVPRVVLAFRQPQPDQNGATTN